MNSDWDTYVNICSGERFSIQLYDRRAVLKLLTTTTLALHSHSIITSLEPRIPHLPGILATALHGLPSSLIPGVIRISTTTTLRLIRQARVIAGPRLSHTPGILPPALHGLAARLVPRAVGIPPTSRLVNLLLPLPRRVLPVAKAGLSHIAGILPPTLHGLAARLVPRIIRVPTAGSLPGLRAGVSLVAEPRNAALAGVLPAALHGLAAGLVGGAVGVGGGGLVVIGEFRFDFVEEGRHCDVGVWGFAEED
jgi:hypothetical protein